jgi:hypothetical protein
LPRSAPTSCATRNSLTSLRIRRQVDFYRHGIHRSCQSCRREEGFQQAG